MDTKVGGPLANNVLTFHAKLHIQAEKRDSLQAEGKMLPAAKM